MDKQDVIYVYFYIEVKFNSEKGGNAAMCYNIDQPGWHHAKWNK